MAGEGAGLDQTPDRGCPKARCQGPHWSLSLSTSTCVSKSESWLFALAHHVEKLPARRAPLEAGMNWLRLGDKDLRGDGASGYFEGVGHQVIEDSAEGVLEPNERCSPAPPV